MRRGGFTAERSRTPAAAPRFSLAFTVARSWERTAPEQPLALRGDLPRAGTGKIGCCARGREEAMGEW